MTITNSRRRQRIYLPDQQSCSTTGSFLTKQTMSLKQCLVFLAFFLLFLDIGGGQPIDPVMMNCEACIQVSPEYMDSCCQLIQTLLSKAIAAEDEMSPAYKRNDMINLDGLNDNGLYETEGRFGKRGMFQDEERFGKRGMFQDEERFGKRGLMDEDRFGKRSIANEFDGVEMLEPRASGAKRRELNGMLRLGKRSSSGNGQMSNLMRLGKRSDVEKVVGLNAVSVKRGGDLRSLVRLGRSDLNNLVRLGKRTGTDLNNLVRLGKRDLHNMVRLGRAPQLDNLVRLGKKRATPPPPKNDDHLLVRLGRSSHLKNLVRLGKRSTDFYNLGKREYLTSNMMRLG